MISAKPKARMTSPMATAGRYVSTTIQTRMVGSMERYLTWARAWPSCSSGSGDSTSCKSPGARRPFGRDLRMSWWFAVVIGGFGRQRRERLKSSGHPERMRSWLRDLLERNIFVGDFRAAAGGSASAVGIVRWRGMAFEVIAARAGTCATTGGGGRSGAFRAASEHAEVAGHDFEAGALLAFLVLPFAGLDAAFDEDERALL